MLITSEARNEFFCGLTLLVAVGLFLSIPGVFLKYLPNGLS